MRKIISCIAIVGILVMSFVACGNSNSQASNDDKKPTENTPQEVKVDDFHRDMPLEAGISDKIKTMANIKYLDWKFENDKKLVAVFITTNEPEKVNENSEVAKLLVKELGGKYNTVNLVVRGTQGQYFVDKNIK